MITVDWVTRVITVPRAYLTPLGGAEYELDTNQFRLDLKALEDDAEGIVHIDTHRHNTVVVLGGIAFDRQFEIINGYTVTFEEFPDEPYSVTLTGSNNNVQDVSNLNNVSIRSANSAGRTVVSDADLAVVLKVLLNKMVTDPDAGTITIYDDDDTSPLFTGPLFEDAEGTTGYRGEGADHRGRMT